MGGFSIGYGIGISPTAKRFSPLGISGLQLWLDSSDGNTLYDSTSGGSIVSADGSAVKRWEDKSGNARHATEATNAPTLETAEKNGLNVLNFATSKYITSSFSTITFTSQTIFFVFKFSTSGLSFCRYFTQGAVGSNDFDLSGNYIPLLRNGTTNQVAIFDAGVGAQCTINATNNDWYVARIRHSGSSVSIKMNGSESASYNDSLNRSIGIFRIGSDYASGGGATQHSNTMISESIVYNKNLTDSESDLVTNYLYSKWAI